VFQIHAKGLRRSVAIRAVQQPTAVLRDGPIVISRERARIRGIGETEYLQLRQSVGKAMPCRRVRGSLGALGARHSGDGDSGDEERPAGDSLRETLHESMVADYFPPDCAADVPTELASVTFTAPIALVSPENVNGMVSENAPPFDSPGALPGSNHWAP